MSQAPIFSSTIQRVTAGITVDGDISDWSNADRVTYSKDTVESTGGFWWDGDNNTIAFAMMYNDEALFCAAEVEDDVISYNEDASTHKEWWMRDGVQWFLYFTGNPEQEVLLYPDIFDHYERDNEWVAGTKLSSPSL